MAGGAEGWGARRLPVRGRAEGVVVKRYGAAGGGRGVLPGGRGRGQEGELRIGASAWGGVRMEGRLAGGKTGWNASGRADGRRKFG